MLKGLVSEVCEVVLIWESKSFSVISISSFEIPKGFEIIDSVRYIIILFIYTINIYKKISIGPHIICSQIFT